MTYQQTPLRRSAHEHAGAAVGPRFATVFLVAALAYTTFHLLFGKMNVVRVQTMQTTLGQLQIRNEAAKARNEKLAAELTELNEGLIGVEEQARASLGMVKPNEIFVSIVPENQPTK